VIAALVALVAGASGARGSAARSSSSPVEYATIYVNYTNNCTFTITNEAGAPLTQIPPGQYQVDVSTPVLFRNLYDAGSDSNDLTACRGFVQFQLTGPGVNLATTLDVGCQDTLTLPATNFPPSSTFTAVDNNNASATKTTFTTAATGTPVVPSGYTGGSNQKSTAGTSSDNIGGNLAPTHHLGAILTAKGATTLLTSAGKRAQNVPQGNAVITLEDSDPNATFVIQQNGSAPIKLTAAKFGGRKTKDVIKEVLFTPGIWKYYTTPHGAVHTFLVIG
jgi:hypothetical protein